MRTIIILILYVIITILSLPMYLIEAIVRLISPRAAAHIAQVIVKGAFNLVMFVSGCKKTIIGVENIPKDTPVMYAANHRSFYDIILAYATVPNQTAFISKMEIKKMPCVAQWMYFLNCLFMNRGDVKQNLQIILSAITLVKNGYSIYIAPEGTRNSGDELLEFHEASFKLAEKSKCPIVPVALNNTDDVLERHLPWIHKTHVIVEYCEPIYMDQMERAEKKVIGKKVREILSEKVKANQREV